MTLLSAVTLLLVHGFGPSFKPCAMPLASSGIAACAAGITPGTLCTATVVSQQINSPIEEEKRGKKRIKRVAEFCEKGNLHTCARGYYRW